MHVDIHKGGFREEQSRPNGSLNYIYGAFLLGFLWPIILTFLIHSLYSMYLRILPRVLMPLLAKMNSTAKDCG